MLGSLVATQLRHTRFMNNFEEFNAKENETIKSVFDRFCAVLNDLRKINVNKTKLEMNLKFLNALQPDWNKSCYRLRNDVRISTMQIQELFEILMTDESLQLAEHPLSLNAYNGSTDDDGEALQKAMILLSQHYQKKFQPMSGSNTSRFTCGSKVNVPELNTVSCYNCEKTGHMSKECRAKAVRDSTYYRNKMELADKRESGSALLAEEEFWLDHSDDEVGNVVIAQMCLVGVDLSDDSDTDEDGVYSEFDYNFITSQFDIMIHALLYLHSNLIYEKNLNSEKSDLIDKLKISLKDEKSILENTKDIFQKKLEQTIFMNKARSEEALKQRWGLGFDNPHCLNKVINEVHTLYKYDYLTLAHYAPQFKFHWTSEKEVLDLENEKRINNKKNEIPFVYTSENAKYFPEKSRRGRKFLNDISPPKSSVSDDFVSSYAPDSDKENISPIIYRALSARSKKQIWKAKLKSTDSMFEGDRYVDKLYRSDPFAGCNKISKYSIKQMILISKNVSYSSFDSSSDDYAFPSVDCAYYSDDIPHVSHIKSAYCFPIRTTTNKQGPKFKWVPKSLSDSKLQSSHVKGE
ncbi:hypothetical protein L6452_32794 [Arctium lappa]|uniref:Uncharacterized protein n=1 Tax=Arctium lappa TaxID=4217 RepID=A0ACB8Z5T7_ARCLA|nr:hypothetical protein L6452_32794 [Arctium lappa]